VKGLKKIEEPQEAGGGGGGLRDMDITGMNKLRAELGLKPLKT